MRRRWLAALGGGLEGAASGLSGYAKLMEQRDVQRRQQDFQKQQSQNQFLDKFMTELSAHPERRDQVKAAGDAMGMDLSKYLPSDQDLMGSLTSKIQGAKDNLSLPTDIGAFAEAGGIPREAPAPRPTPDFVGPMPNEANPLIGDLQKQIEGRKAAIGTEQAAATQRVGENAWQQGYGQTSGADTAQHEAAPAKLEDTLAETNSMTPLLANRAGLIAGLQFDANHTPDRMAAEAKGKGMNAGAEAGATFPWQEQLAQVRADRTLANETTLDDYKRAHPKATAGQLDQKAGAGHALTMIDQVRQLENAMDQQGMLGALKGRAADFMSGKLKSEQVFKNPEQAQLASEFFSEMGLLQKLAARVHGGVRAAASPMMAQQFEKIISGIGDRHIVDGQLNAVERVMKVYQDNPDAPELIDIPGLNMNPTVGPQQIDPTIQELLNR